MEGIEGSNLTRSQGWLGWPLLTMILTMIGAFTLKKPIVHNDFDNDDYGWEWWHCQWHSVRQSLHSYLKDITTLCGHWTMNLKILSTFTRERYHYTNVDTHHSSVYSVEIESLH